jgi:hypothetical protein
MAKKNRGPRGLIDEGTFRLYERKEQTWKPLLRTKIEGLNARIEDKQTMQGTASPAEGAE